MSSGTTVIMMTAFGTPDVTAGALKLGASRVLSKPFNMHDLEDVVRAL
jgi:DNA-binding response OmpR family regulator